MGGAKARLSPSWGFSAHFGFRLCFPRGCAQGIELEKMEGLREDGCGGCGYRCLKRALDGFVCPRCTWQGLRDSCLFGVATLNRV